MLQPSPGDGSSRRSRCFRFQAKKLNPCRLWMTRCLAFPFLFSISLPVLAQEIPALPAWISRHAVDLRSPVEPGQTSSAKQAEDSSPITPEEWTKLILSACSDREERWQESRNKLDAELQARAESREQLAFPGKELQAHGKHQDWQRRAEFARLDYLWLGEKAGALSAPAENYRRAASRPRLRGKTPLLQTLNLLLAGTSPCTLEALESTFFFSVFDVPLTRERLSAGLDNHHLQAELDGAYRAQLKKSGSLEETYLKLRPADAENSFRYADHLLAQLVTLEAMRAQQSRSRRTSASAKPTTGDGNAGGLEGFFATSEPGPSPSAILEGAELSAILEKLERHMHAASEPLRIQIYLREKVEEIQGVLRAGIPEASVEKLLESAEKALYRDERALEHLGTKPGPQVLNTLEAVLDKWFDKEGLPALQESLYNDPFAAYWFFVQTGAVARGTTVHRESHIGLRADILSLENLKGLRLRDALARFKRDRVPSEFSAAHAALEQTFSGVMIKHSDVPGRIDAAMLAPKYRAKLQQHFSAPDDRESLSTTDAYGWMIRDAHKMGGHLDRDLLRGSLELLDQEKRESMQRVLPGLLLTVAEEQRGRCKEYLEVLSKLILELELGQATDKHYQETTSGGFTGWFLSHFLMSTGVPVNLWAPGGVTGEEFRNLLDSVAPKNKESGDDYHGKPSGEIRFLHDGQEFHEALVGAIDSSGSFLNLMSLDWKADQGGKETAYRLMAKKLGIEGELYNDFLETFHKGLPLQPEAPEPTLFYDVPPRQMKNLLFYYLFRTSALTAIREAREGLERALGEELTCPSVETCGDLSALKTRAGQSYQAERTSEPGYAQAWEAYRKLESLFEDAEVSTSSTRSRASLAEYVADGDRLRTFIRRYGRKRADDPSRTFPINIIVDGKQDLMNLRFIRPNKRFPFVYADPYWNLYTSLYEFDIRLLLWKGALEFPWHVGNVPVPGRNVFHHVPFPFVPYPWLRFVPGFSPAGIFGSLFVQQMLAADPRTWWAMVAHGKSVSSESTAIESGMGFATKYFDEHEDFLTWHDMGIEVKGPVVGDVNDDFVLLFNEARVNNAGLPGSHKVKVPRLRYEDYRYECEGVKASRGRAWVFVTHPEKGDASYRGAYMAALAAARKNIYIETPWLTDPLVARMLLHKAREFRGRVNCQRLADLDCATKMREAVKIYLVLPDATDQHALDVVGRSHLREMLHLGVKIYWWAPQKGWSATKMLHTKAWLIDYAEGEAALAYVGSANATQRSHLADNEIGIVTTSPAFVGESYDRLFRYDLATDTRLESPDTFHFPWGKRRLAGSARRLQHLLVGMFWFF